MDHLSTDNELIDYLSSDNTEAFDLIYKKYSKKLYLFGLKYLKSVDETEELVQTVFLKVWENRKNLKKELSFNSYLFTIAYNDICRFFRKRNYQKQFVDETLNKNKHISVQTEESIEYQSILNRIEEIAEMLPERQKVVFKKSRFDGLTNKEIAKQLKLSQGTIDNYISEALKFIRIGIEKENLKTILFFFLFIS